MDQNEKNKKDARIVLTWIIGFFLTFIAVDSFFVYKALTTHTGTVEKIHGR